MILWASPLPPIRSGVSDYAVELLEELRRRTRVRVVRPPEWTPDGDWPFGPDVELVGTDTEPADGETEILHLGNNPHHLWLLPRLDRGGSVLVLHDLVLHHLAVEATASQGDLDQLEAILSACHGTHGASLARARRFGISGRRDPFLFPTLEWFLKRAAGCVVHSGWAANRVRTLLPELQVELIGLSAADPSPVDRDRIRHDLDIAPSEVVLMHLGFLTREKGLEEIVAGVAAARACEVPAVLLLVGEGSAGRRLVAAADRFGGRDWIRTTGWIDRDLFRAIPGAADLGVVLRTPSAGETSAAGVRFLAAGTPVAVSGHRQFLDWPERAAPRITPGPAAAADIARLLGTINADDSDWSGRRAIARRTYEERHRPADAADRLVAFVRELSVG